MEQACRAPSLRALPVSRRQLFKSSSDIPLPWAHLINLATLPTHRKHWEDGFVLLKDVAAFNFADWKRQTILMSVEMRRAELFQREKLLTLGQLKNIITAATSFALLVLWLRPWQRCSNYRKPNEASGNRPQPRKGELTALQGTRGDRRHCVTEVLKHTENIFRKPLMNMLKNSKICTIKAVKYLKWV